jgi:hypothetical protein
MPVARRALDRRAFVRRLPSRSFRWSGSAARHLLAPGKSRVTIVQQATAVGGERGAQAARPTGHPQETGRAGARTSADEALLTHTDTLLQLVAELHERGARTSPWQSVLPQTRVMEQRGSSTWRDQPSTSWTEQTCGATGSRSSGRTHRLEGFALPRVVVNASTPSPPAASDHGSGGVFTSRLLSVD